MQQTHLKARAERVTTSCGECRRRKQRCSQGQPCTNCARRFPQPVCEYKATRRANPPGVSDLPTFTVALGSASNAEPVAQSSPVDTPSLPWVRPQPPRGGGGEVVKWSGIDIPTRYPSTVSLDRLLLTSQPLAPSSSNVCLHNLAIGDRDRLAHSEAVHDAVTVMVRRRSVPYKFLERLDARQPFEVIMHTYSFRSGPPSWPSLSQSFRLLPMDNDKLNGELLVIFLRVLSRYKASVDGNPDPNSPLVQLYFPFCIHNPLLLQIILYTAACFMNETGHLPQTSFMAQKSRTITMLNDHLRDLPLQTTDAAIAGVMQLIVDEWYWGDSGDLQAHLRGLREMIRLRGGLHNLGMNGLLAKMVISHDVGIALAHESKPFLQDGAAHDLGDAAQTPFNVAHNTPLLSTLPSFAACANALGLHQSTASILDDIRFLISSVMSIPSETTATADLHKIQRTAHWVYDRISRLPADSPKESESTPTQAPVVVFSSGDTTRQPDPVDTDDGHATANPNGATPSRSSGEEATYPTKIPEETQDNIYKIVRLSALIWCQALVYHKPLSKTCPASEFVEIWTTTWSIPLTKWKALLGIFNWVMLTVVPACHNTAHERSVRTMFMISMVSRAVENWPLTLDACVVSRRIQSWLGQGDELDARSRDMKRRRASAQQVGLRQTAWTDEN